MSKLSPLSGHLPSALILTILLGSLVLSFFAVASVLLMRYSPSHIPPNAHALSPDAWIQDGTEIGFEGLFIRGNRLIIEFDPWRPQGAEAALF